MTTTSLDDLASADVLSNQGVAPEFVAPATDDHDRAPWAWLRRRYAEILVTAGLFLLVFVQHSGEIERDTKLDVTVDPGRFLAMVTHLWNPQIAFGSISDQEYGYLFPMGPFYWLGSALHVPVWIVERVWLGLLLAVAFWGVVRLAEVLGIGTRWWRVAGGVAYALSPIVLALAHDTGYIFPTVLLPWVLVPLKRAAEGKLTLRSGAARSGLAVLLMGGLNASLTFGVLLLPVLWFVAQRPVRRHARLFAYWCVAVFLATAWFLVPLLFQDRYGFGFFTYTETAIATTGSSFIPEVLRGAGIWTSYNGPPLWSPAGHLIEIEPALIVATACLAGVGLYGLARRDMPERLFLGLSVIAGVLLVCAGYDGRLGGPLAASYQSLLNGPLASFRNVYKFQPIITLPLILGMTHALARWSGSLQRWSLPRRFTLRGVIAVLTVGTILVAATPAFSAEIYPDGSFTAIPTYYHQAANWLNGRGASSTTLILPGNDFSRFTWGSPLDNPMQALLTVPWANRNIVPMGSVGNTQVLDAVDQVLANGQPSPGLAAFLDRAGIRYILIENDLEPAETSSPTPALMRLVMAQEPGITRVARFGPVVRQPNTGYGKDRIFDPIGATAKIRSLEIYKVTTPAPHTPLVTTYPAAQGVVLSGGPQGLLAMADAGQLNGEAVTLSGDPLGPTFSRTRWVDADTQQLRPTQYTLLYNNESNVLSPTEARGGVDQFIVVPGIAHETVSHLSNGVSVSASSFGPEFSRVPSEQPLSAFLADSGGAPWVASASDAVPWIEIRFSHPVSLHRISVTPSVQTNEAVVSKVRISTDHGAVTHRLADGSSPQEMSVPAGRTRYLKIALVDVDRGQGGADSPPGLAHVRIPGVKVTQSLVVPDDGPQHLSAPPTYLFTSPIADQLEYLKFPDDETQMERTFTVSGKGGPYVVTGQATPLVAPAVPTTDLGAPVTVACGSGPTLNLDGHEYQTAVSGQAEQLYSKRPMTLTLCTPGAALQLTPGVHTIVLNDPTGTFKVTQLALASSPAPAVKPPRSTSIDQWGEEVRTLTVSSGPSAILNVRQNYNVGWTASVDGRTLRPVRLDGWQQGWILPAASTAQNVTLRFSPDRTFQGSLAFGGILALALVVAAVWPGTPRGGQDLVATETAFDAVESASSKRRRHARRTPRWSIVLAVLAIAAALYLVAGPVAAALPLVLLPLRWIASERPVLAWVALGAEVLAGVAIALDSGFRLGVWVGSGGYLAQALGAVAVAALALSLVPRPSRQLPSRTGEVT